MDTAHPPPPPPCLSIPGFLGSSRDGHSSPPPPVVSWDSWDTQTIPGSSWDGHSSTPPPLSEYPGIPGILGRSQDHPGMDTAHSPPCLSILGFLGYSDDPGIIPGWTQLTPPPPCLSILGFLGYSDDPGIILGWTHLTPPPPCLSILGFLRYSDDPRIIPGWMDTALPPLSEYPGIPGILGRSWDHPGMDTAHPPPCLSILGFLGYSDDPGIILGWTQLYPPPPPPPV